jgi:plastocyanin
MKRLIAVLVAVAAVAAAIAVPAFAATKTVKVGPHRSFGPKSLRIKSGDTVKFQWTGSLPHNVVITKGPHKGKIAGVKTKGTVLKKFRTKGSYTIVCQIHPGMTLKLKVT